MIDYKEIETMDRCDVAYLYTIIARLQNDFNITAEEFNEAEQE